MSKLFLVHYSERMTIFDEYDQHKESRISPHLLWEYDLETFDWERSKVLVVQRVIERGRIEDFYGAINLYGGMEAFKAIIKEIPYLADIDRNFVCNLFGIKEEELRCYRQKQLRERLMNS